jgi:regulator of replication initiation timing
MTNRYEELINAFEKKLRKLISGYQSLQLQNAKLKADLATEHESLMKAHSEILELRKKNDHLILAGQIGGSGEGRSAAKKQIDKMVREIDQCLALLDE